MSFDVFTDNPHARVPAGMREKVIAEGQHRLSPWRRWRTIIAAGLALAAGLPLLLRVGPDISLVTGHEPPAQQLTTTPTNGLPDSETKPAPIVVRTPNPTCDAPLLVPDYLPPGFEPVGEPSDVGLWTITYASGDARIHVYGGFAGDWGDDPRVKRVQVRNTDATAGQTGGFAAGSAAEYLVTWKEAGACSGYAVRGIGISQDETIAVAQSLRPEPTN